MGTGSSCPFDMAVGHCLRVSTMPAPEGTQGRDESRATGKLHRAAGAGPDGVPRGPVNGALGSEPINRLWLSLCDSVPTDDTCRLSTPTRSMPGPPPGTRKVLWPPSSLVHTEGAIHMGAALQALRQSGQPVVLGLPVTPAVRPSLRARWTAAELATWTVSRQVQVRTLATDNRSARHGFRQKGTTVSSRSAVRSTNLGTDSSRQEPPILRDRPGFPRTAATLTGCSRQRTARPHPDNRPAVVAVRDHHEARPRIATIGIATVPGGRAGPAGGCLRAEVPVAESCTEPARPTRRTNGIASGREAKQR